MISHDVLREGEAVTRDALLAFLRALPYHPPEDSRWKAASGGLQIILGVFHKEDECKVMLKIYDEDTSYLKELVVPRVERLARDLSACQRRIPGER